MIVTPFDPPDLTLPDDPHRPKGLHLSAVIKDLLKVIDPLKYKDSLPFLKITSGMALEAAMERALYPMVPGSFRPPPIQHRGIWCSPDSVSMDPWRVREFKLTWYSAKKECPWHDVFWPWRVQMMGYCSALETRLTELWVLFLNGDYRPPSPGVQTMTIEFSQQELDENWMMIENHAKARGWL